jgi:undecaprenyl diphosphate synthase
MFAQSSKRDAVLRELGINPANLPNHIAIIMDGNGRWAKKRGLARINGHREAVKAVRASIEACSELGIKYLTLFAFSVDNWKRPKDEVNSLMSLLENFLRKERKTLIKNQIHFIVIGDIARLPAPVQNEIKKSIEATEKYSEYNLVLALNYGGRADIIHGVKNCVEKCLSGEIKPADISEDFFSNCLYTKNIPDPDLLIRTSGESRISNFLLWQVSYAEIWITPVLCPDFTREDLIKAVVDYSKRERRYGGVLMEQ